MGADVWPRSLQELLLVGADHFSEDCVEAHAMLMAFKDRPER